MVSNFKKKRKTGPFNKFLLIVGAISISFLFVFLVVSNVKVYKKKQQLNAHVEDLKNKIENIQKQNDGLREGILKTDDPAYIEKVAREELDLQKPGEKVISFIKTENNKSQNNSQQKNIFEYWLSWLGNIFKK